MRKKITLEIKKSCYGLKMDLGSISEGAMQAPCRKSGIGVIIPINS